MDRRAFMKTCTLGAGILAGGGVPLPSGAAARQHRRIRLVNVHRQPLRAEDVLAGSQYVFHYPFSATPCFLLNLGRPAPGKAGLMTEAGQRYDWPGGVGPQRSLVAYSAICAHQLAHPTRAISYIGFRGQRADEEPDTGVISCCAENSRYDPFAGAAVLSGPAPQPLAAVLLEHDAGRDELHALGTLGGELFQRFFNEFEARLAIEYPRGDGRILQSGDVAVQRLEDFTANLLSC